MITEEATVLRIDGARAWVSPRTVADCERCAVGRGSYLKMSIKVLKRPK